MRKWCTQHQPLQGCRSLVIWCIQTSVKYVGDGWTFIVGVFLIALPKPTHSSPWVHSLIQIHLAHPGLELILKPGTIFRRWESHRR